MEISRFLFRMWFYFRMGYTVYLSFLLGFATTLVTVYYLAINNIPALQVVFPHFWLFVIIAFSVGVPMACFIGWVHMKGSALWKSEVDITVEANPYLYKVYPGYWKEAFTPFYLELLRGMRKILEKEELMSAEEEEKFKDLERKLEILIKGGYLGVPKTKANLETTEN